MTPRPLQHLRDLKAKCPDIWRQAADLRARPTWPSWCYLPIEETRSLDLDGGFAEATALLTWRATQGIYRVHPEMLHAIAQTESHGKIPAEIFFHLPEWCIYVETPGVGMSHGFFVHLNHNGHAAELCFVLDGSPPLNADLLHQSNVASAVGISESELVETLSKALWPVYFELSPDKTLEETIGGSVQLAMMSKHSTPKARRAQAQMQQMLDSGHMKFSTLAKMLRPYLALTLYLCSQSAEYRHAAGKLEKPTLPRPVKTRHGMKLFPPDQPNVWEVSYRMGAALQAAQQRADAETSPEYHRGKRPHIRRAHWHLYWTGPRSGPQVPVLKWLPPIPVGVEDLEDLVPVVRPA